MLIHNIIICMYADRQSADCCAAACLQCDGVQPMVTVDDCIEAEEIFKEDEGVQRALRERYGICDPNEVACDPWYYGQRYSATPHPPQCTRGRF